MSRRGAPATATRPARPTPGWQAILASAVALHREGRVDAAIPLYRAVLRERADQPDALHMLGLARHHSGEPAAALELIDRALAAALTVAGCHANRGVVLRALGRPDEAAAAFARAVELAPGDAEAWSNYGVALGETGRLEAAIDAYRHSLALRPTNARAHSNLGNALAKLGRLDEAEAAQRAAVAADPGFAIGRANLGRLLVRRGQAEEALGHLREALRLAPENPETLAALAQGLLVDEKLDEAAPLAERALGLAPENGDVLATMAAVAYSLGDHGRAAALARAALARQPDNADALGTLGASLLAAGRFEDAVEPLAGVVAVRPGWADARSNLGNALAGTGDLAGAEEQHREAIALQPHRAELHANAGAVLQLSLKLDETIEAFDDAIARAPDTGVHHLNLALACLLKGDLARGWAEYDWRWRCDDYAAAIRPLPQPAWDGGDLAGRHILVTGEQGVGDEIMFAGLLPELAAAGARVSIEAHHRLVPLLARSFPDVAVHEARNPPLAAVRGPDIDVRAAGGDLLRHLRPAPDRFRPVGRYLCPDPDRVAACRTRYDALGPGLKVGISWSSGNRSSGRRRTAALERWEPLFRIPDLVFVNLQYGDTAAEIAEAEARFGVRIHSDATVDPLADLDGFAAQIDALDLVVSIDNSTVHMAGALGKPTWVLLPFSPDWRWFLGTDRSVWYESVRLLRQPRPGAWAPVFADAAARLAACAADGLDPADEGRAPVAPVAATAPPSGRRVLLLNDTSNWYHWGCTGTSTALRQAIAAFGHSCTSVPIDRVYALRAGPARLEDFDCPHFFDAFAAANPLLVRRLREADIVIVNGEGTLHGMSQPVLNLLYAVHAAKRHLGKIVQIVNHSCYPQDDAGITDALANGLYKKVYTGLDFVAVREHVSAGLLARLGLDVTLAFDCLPLYIADNYEPRGARAERTLVVAGSAAIAAARMDEFARYLAGMAADGWDIRVLVGARAFPALDDTRFVEALRRIMPTGWTLFDAPTMDAWLEAIETATLFVSGRFHHSIAAASLGTPFVTMSSVTPKIAALLELLEHAPLVPIGSAELCARLRAAGAAELTAPQDPATQAARLAMLHELGLRNFLGLAALDAARTAA